MEKRKIFDQRELIPELKLRSRSTIKTKHKHEDMGVELKRVSFNMEELQPARDPTEIRRGFEAGGTKIWGIDFDSQSATEMSSLTPIQENDSISDVISNRSTYLAAGHPEAATPSPIPRRRQSELRTKHQHLWQKAAKQVKINEGGGSRRKSILPIEDITDDLLARLPEEDEEENEINMQHEHRFSVFSVKPHGDHLTPTNKTTITPLRSVDIEKNVKPQMRAAYKCFGFLFPRLPTNFTTGVNEPFYQRYYTTKKKSAMFVINIVYIVFLLCLYIASILPAPHTDSKPSRDYLIRETIFTAILVVFHIAISIFIKRANTDFHVRICAILTWTTLLLQIIRTAISGYVDHNFIGNSSTTNIPWNVTGLWQTALLLFVTFHFLSVITLRISIILSLGVLFLHLIFTTTLNHFYVKDSMGRIGLDLVIHGAILISGVFNHYLVERTERKAFLEIRTCIEARHTVSKENQSQERLVLSVLPKFIVEEINNDFKQNTNGFAKMFLHRYENVSILFADICGFTTLGSLLTPKLLVNMLNNLFANFDKLAKRHKCLRIKLLGDCYESVCGIPDFKPDHADNCVGMGLDMIDAIRVVRNQQRVDVLDMRIGVHTGAVFCGVLGLRKWQFDIYSDDVKTANMMESSGSKGNVHISEATKNSLTKDFEGIVENDTLDNEYLREIGVKTYFITRPERAYEHAQPQPNGDHNGNGAIPNGDLRDVPAPNHLPTNSKISTDVAQPMKPGEPTHEPKQPSGTEVASTSVETSDSSSAITTPQKVVDESEKPHNLQPVVQPTLQTSGVTPQSSNGIHKHASDDNNPQENSDTDPKRCNDSPEDVSKRSLEMNRENDVVVQRALKAGNRVSLAAGVTIVEPPACSCKSCSVTPSINGTRASERRLTVHSFEQECIGCELTTKIPSQFRASSDNTLHRLMERATDSKADKLWSKQLMKPITLTYKKSKMEKKFSESRDNGFQTNLISLLLYIIAILVTQTVSNMASSTSMLWISPLLCSIVLLAVAIFTIIILLVRVLQFLKFHKDSNGKVPNDSNFFSRSYESILSNSRTHRSTIPRSFTVRNAITTIFLVVLFISTIVKPIYYKSMDMDEPFNSYSAYMWLAWLLVLLATTSFLHWNHLIKVLTISLMMILYIIIYEVTSPHSISAVYYATQHNSSNSNGDAATAMTSHHIMYERIEYLIVLIFSALLLVYNSRVLESHSRLSFLWRLQAKQELEEMDHLRDSNLLLLRNILPEHVANHFLGKYKRDEELYCESYNNVAVMFAAIANFNEFWLAVPGNDHGKGCLVILNEIIADFDDLLGQPSFIEVEKIKTIGSTYMTCVGLSPVQKNENNCGQNLKTSVDLAFGMMKALRDINDNGFGNDFQLRIGINHGPVVAGVIGARKPHYDIWGHTVNLASRMESNGKANQIQVMERTAQILEKAGQRCTYRATIGVKGITEPVNVYTVNTPPEESDISPPPTAGRRPITIKSFQEAAQQVIQQVVLNSSTKRNTKADQDEMDSAGDDSDTTTETTTTEAV